VFFFLHTSLELLRQYPSTLVLDSTYKPNRHGLYLLNIVGATATSSSFVIGQAFIHSEDEKTYSWVLDCVRECYKEASLDLPRSITTDKAGGLMNAIESIFPDVPHLLCIWHVNNDIEAHCRELWRGQISTTEGCTTAEERAQYIQSRWELCEARWREVLYVL
jgi:hypothetical protein